VESNDLVTHHVLARLQVLGDFDSPEAILGQENICSSPLAVIETSLVDLEPDFAKWVLEYRSNTVAITHTRYQGSTW
jgi:hypothetical protein